MQRESSQPTLFTPPDILPESAPRTVTPAALTATNTAQSSSAGIALPVSALSPARAQPEGPPPPKPREKPPLGPAPPILARLTDDHLNYAPAGSRFESIAAQTLDNAGTGDDGFDDMAASVLQSFGDDTPALASLDQNLSDADFVTGEFADTYHAPIVAELQPLLDAGDAALSDLAGTFGGVIPPVALPGTSLDIGFSPGGGGDSSKFDPSYWFQGFSNFFLDGSSLGFHD